MGFPMNPPLQAIDHVIAYIRGQGDHDVKLLAEDAYDILGYGLFLTVGSHNEPKFSHVGMPQIQDVEKSEAFAQELENMKRKTGVFPTWLLQAVWQLLQQLLNKEFEKKQGFANPVANFGQKTMHEVEQSGTPESAHAIPETKKDEE